MTSRATKKKKKDLLLAPATHIPAPSVTLMIQRAVQAAARQAYGLPALGAQTPQSGAPGGVPGQQAYGLPAPSALTPHPGVVGGVLGQQGSPAFMAPGPQTGVAGTAGHQAYGLPAPGVSGTFAMPAPRAPMPQAGGLALYGGPAPPRRPPGPPPARVNSTPRNARPGITCYSCNQQGHVARDCPSKKCTFCGLQGVTRSECPACPCARCAQAGHTVRDCKEPDRRACRKCRKPGVGRFHCT